jgi:hypothetical protein
MSNIHEGGHAKTHIRQRLQNGVFQLEGIADNFFRYIGSTLKLAESRRSLAWTVTKMHFPF